MEQSFAIRPATGQDTPAMLEILDAAKAVMHSQGIPQWQNGYPNQEVLRQDIAKGGSWLLLHYGAIAGTAAMLAGQEPTYAKIYQGAWPGGGMPYCTLHRIAVSPACKGTGAAASFYTMLEDWCRTQGAHSIRVDTHRANTTMRRFLAKCGFTECGIIYLEDGAERLAFEKIL